MITHVLYASLILFFLVAFAAAVYSAAATHSDPWDDSWSASPESVTEAIGAVNPPRQNMLEAMACEALARSGKLLDIQLLAGHGDIA